MNMDDIVRQKKEHHKKGVLELSQHKVREAFQTFNKEIHEVPRDELEKYALNLRAKMNDPSIIVNTNAQRVAVNKIISSQRGQDLQSGPGFEQRIWTPVYLSKTQKKWRVITKGRAILGLPAMSERTSKEARFTALQKSTMREPSLS